MSAHFAYDELPPEHEQGEPADEDDGECWCAANWQCEACWVEFLEACCE